MNITNQPPGLTLESLPKAFSLLAEEVSVIRRLLESKEAANPGPGQWMNLSELRNYLPDRPAISTVYTWAHQRRIPFHKGGKKLRFLKPEIDEWLKSGKVKPDKSPEVFLKRREKRRA